MTGNLDLWDRLAKTDPSHTKAFNRAGGFKGTSVKPIYVVRKLTEQFGPCGQGWGVGKPEFQVVPCEGEVLVFCTVSCWHGTRDNELFGVGGDKVQAKRRDGAFCDDEAFKKAFTDAVNNAFKFIGVSADVHMGQFDDDKYVTALKQEFAEDERRANLASDADQALIMTMAQTAGVPLADILDRLKIKDLRELPADSVEGLRKKLQLTIDQRTLAEQKDAA